MRFARTLMFSAAILVLGSAGALNAEDKVDSWGLTQAQWNVATDLEIARATEILLQCEKVKAITPNADSRSLMLRAIAYRNGICFDESPVEASRWFDLAAAANEPRALLAKGALIVDRASSVDEMREGFSLIKRAANMGDFRAKAALAAAYFDGVAGVAESDKEKAVRLTAEALRAGFWPMIDPYLEMAAKIGIEGRDFSPSEIAAMWKRAAENGNYLAIREYVKALETGSGVAIDKTAAAYWRKQQTLRENTGQPIDKEIFDAFIDIGMSWNVIESDQQRFARLEAEAAAGDSNAMAELASLLAYGSDVVTANPSRAVQLYKQAAALGNESAVHSAAYYLLDSSSPYFEEAEGVRLLRQDIKTNKVGGAESRRRLAMYLAFAAQKPDFAQAVRLLREGVALGDSYSIRDLAALLRPQSYEDPAEKGLRNAREAIALYERFLALPEGQQDFDAMAELATLYAYDSEDRLTAESKANDWISRSVAGGSTLGKLYQGDFVFYGNLGRTSDFAKAKAIWTAAAAERSDWNLSDRIAMVDEALTEDRNTVTSAAMIQLGMNYEFGTERPVNWEKAQYWLQRGINAGSTDRNAVWHLARLYDYDGFPAKAEPLWRRLMIGSDEIAVEARGRVAALERARAPAQPQFTPAAPIASNVAPAASPKGAPGARQIRDALVYENTFGRVTGNDVLGLVQRQADYETGSSRVTTFGITMEQTFGISNARCSGTGDGSYSCQYDLQLNNSLGIPYSGRGSHNFVVRNGIWRSPTYLKAIIESGNRSAANVDQRQCTVQGFGTAEGASIRDRNGLPC